ncbi:MAG: hypothetical protein GY816_22775 [Cytophagales bacterium]|nr:hypothetical protein [Cytophagales bacterium]
MSTNGWRETCKRTMLSANLLPSTTRLKVGHGWASQYDNNPQHTAKAMKEWLKKKHMKVMKWPRQFPNINPKIILWRELKLPFAKLQPYNFNDLEIICKEKWTKIPSNISTNIVIN